jgi:hypothetical protein
MPASEDPSVQGHRHASKLDLDSIFCEQVLDASKCCTMPDSEVWCAVRVKSYVGKKTSGLVGHTNIGPRQCLPLPHAGYSSLGNVGIGSE